MADVASSAGPHPRRSRTPLLGLAATLLFVVTVVLPVGLIVTFRFVPPPATPLMMATTFSTGEISHRWTPLDAISPHLVRAVIASEDGKFCSHQGFDFEAIDKALDN